MGCAKRQGNKIVFQSRNNFNSVNFSPDGNFIYTKNNDGSFRIWNIDDGNEIARFISFYNGEWIVITPGGYYNASPKGDQYLNVRIENNVYGIDQFAKIFYRPDIVERRLQGLDDPEDFNPKINIYTASIPPAVNIDSFEIDQITRQVTLSVTAYDNLNRINDIEIIVNGRLIGGDELKNVKGRNLKAEQTRISTTVNKKDYVFTVPVQLDPGFNRIEIVANNDLNFGFTQIYFTNPQAQDAPKSSLYILAVGVDNYGNNSEYNLTYPSDDAQRITATFKKQEEVRYNSVNILRISDKDEIPPTRENILKNINDFFKQAKPDDIVLLFLSGHGKTIESQGGSNREFYFLPSDTRFNRDGSFNTATAISASELTAALDLPGRKIIMIDTCESAGVDNNRLVRTIKNRSTVLFSASKADEVAIESGMYGGGIFTTGIVEGLTGEKTAVNGQIPLVNVGEFVIERVSEISSKTQTPVVLIPDTYNDFIIARVMD